MRLVQAEQDALSKGWPLGDGIGLFGLGSSGSGLPSGGAAKRQDRDQERGVELNASAGQAQGSPLGAAGGERSGGTSRQPLFGGGPSSSSATHDGSPPSKAAALREKYASRAGGTSARAGAAPPSSAPPPRRQEEGEGAVDALFEVVESRPSRGGGSRLLDQSQPSSYSFAWKPRGR
jgi:hypothetical protein